MRDLLGGGPVILMAAADALAAIDGSAPTEIKPWGVADFEELHSDLQRFIQTIADFRESRDGGLVPSLKLSAEYGAIPGDRPGQLFIAVDGRAADLLRLQFLELLRHTGTHRVMRCHAHVADSRGAATCGRIFVRSGRRDFCSTTCQKRAYMKRVREQQRQPKRRVRHHGKKTRTR